MCDKCRRCGRARGLSTQIACKHCGEKFQSTNALLSTTKPGPKSRTVNSSLASSPRTGLSFSDSLSTSPRLDTSRKSPFVIASTIKPDSRPQPATSSAADSIFKFGSRRSASPGSTLTPTQGTGFTLRPSPLTSHPSNSTIGSILSPKQESKHPDTNQSNNDFKFDEPTQESILYNDFAMTSGSVNYVQNVLE